MARRGKYGKIAPRRAGGGRQRAKLRRGRCSGDERAGTITQDSERKFDGGRDVKRGRTGGTEGVTCGELPHAGEQLAQAADEERHAEDDVRRCDLVGRDIDEGEDEGRRREGEQTTAK